MHAFKTELYLKKQKVAAKYKRTRMGPFNNKIEKKLFASISSKRFQPCLSSVSYDYFWLLNQTYLRHTLESNNENEKFNHVTFVNIEEFLMQNDSITLIFTKNYGV